MIGEQQDSESGGGRARRVGRNLNSPLASLAMKSSTFEVVRL